jgi:hypothetical protein
MRLHGQRGQTVIELLVGMAVTSIVMGVMAGLLYVASDRGSQWADRVNSAADGFALASTLQADLHSYFPCPGDTDSDADPNLILNTPGTTPNDRAVLYYASGNPAGRHEVTRVQAGPLSQTRHVGGAAGQPVYRIQQGVIRIQHVLSSGADLLIYFSPLPGSCP